MKINRFAASVFTLVVLIFFSNLPAQSGILPNGFAELRLAQGLDGTTVNYAPDGRLFITQKKGVINIIKNGNLLTLVDLQSIIDNSNERGLQSLTFDPNFASNGYIYVYYAAKGQGRNRVSRFTVIGDAAAAASEFVVVDLENLPGTIHNGGAIFFKGGKLFITTGDGGKSSNSQSFSSLLGKVLRINSDGSIPEDNPYFSSLTGKFRLIYALGFRNPFRASVQPVTERVFINDVGASNWEEINDLIAGKNYGWPTVEGKRVAQVAPDNYQDPIYAYSHAEGCSIGGGAFYNPTTTPFPNKYIGKYFFGDYCNNYIKVLDPNTGTVTETFATNVNRPISFSIGDDGAFYYLARGGLQGGGQEANTQSCCSEIWRINYTQTGVPSISAEPGDVQVAQGEPAIFAVGASGNGPLQYQWQRNGVDIPGATSFRYEITSTTLADNNATFRAVITNSLGSATSRNALLKVSSDLPPLPVITSPTEGALYEAGTVLNFEGQATDPEDGILPASAYKWEIVFHHATHTHPAMAPVTGVTSGSYNLDGTHDPATDVWYRIYLTVTDSEGQSSTVYRDVHPRLTNITLAANNPSVKLKLDGQEVNTPTLFTGVSGIIRNIEAPSPQVINGITYEFFSWSNGGTANQNITTPSNNTTYTALYMPLLLEAEQATLSRALVQFSYAGYTGTGYADYTNDNNGFIEWNTTVPAEGSFKLDVKYGNGSRGNRPLKIEVNGQVIEASQAFNPTGSWTSWGVVSVTAYLTAGTNTIRISTIGAPGPNLDHLLIYPSPGTTTVASPVFSPAGGTYTETQAVSITSSTPNANIYFTLDGSIPSTSSTLYTSALSISTTTTVKAIAVKTGMNTSEVVTASYTINPLSIVQAPSFSPAGGNYTTPQMVTISTLTPGATIHYTIDGTTPSQTSPPYTTPIAIAANTTLKALAVKPGLINSSVASATYVIDEGSEPYTQTLEAEEAILSGVSVQKNTAGFTGTGFVDYVGNSGAYIEWRPNIPTTGEYVIQFRYANGGRHNRPLEIKVNDVVVLASKAFPSTNSWSSWQLTQDTVELLAGLNTIRATSIGANGGNFDHLVITKITASTLAPVFSPVPGTYNSPVAVTLSSSTSGASIYYTVDGSTPTTSSTLYTAPVSVNTSTTIKAIAVDASLLSSEVIEGTYVIQTTPPFSVTLEAESAARSGVLILFSYTGYTGTGYGDFVNASNDYLEWTVDVPSSGMYEIGFRYALLNGNRPLRIDVNSSTIESSLSFPVTASWTNWSMIKKWIPLAAGPNKIKAIAIGSSGPNIDHITVSNDASSGSLTAARSKQFYDEMESQLTNVIDIFPVPANQTLHVSGPSAVEFVNIIQMDGRIVVPYHQYTRENSIEVDVSNIPSGLSVVTLRDGKQIIRKKVLIQH